MSDGSNLVIGAANDELGETLLRKDVGGPPEGAAGLTVVNLQDGSPAIIGFSHNDPGVSGRGGSGVVGFGQVLGVFGSGPVAGVYAGSSRGTGLIAAGQTAAWFFGPVEISGDIEVSGNLTVSGFKAAAVTHPDGSRRLLYAVESPESWFEDFGEARLKGGRASVALDPDFVELVEPHSYQVFLTTYGPVHLCVESRGPEGFEVATTSSDQPGDVGFGYRVVARRRGAPGSRLERSDPFERELPEQPTPPAAPATPTAPARVRESNGP